MGNDSCSELNGEKGDHDRFEVEPMKCDGVLTWFDHIHT